jgi:hypothetical protein
MMQVIQKHKKVIFWVNCGQMLKVQKLINCYGTLLMCIITIFLELKKIKVVCLLHCIFVNAFLIWFKFQTFVLSWREEVLLLCLKCVVFRLDSFLCSMRIT